MIFEVNLPYGQSDFTVNVGPTRIISKKVLQHLSLNKSVLVESGSVTFVTFSQLDDLDGRREPCLPPLPRLATLLSEIVL